MNLPESVHVLALDVTIEDREMTLNLSAIETEGGLLLLDTGLPDTTAQLTERLEAAGFGLSDIGMVLITHEDIDHAGGLTSVVEESGATVLAHERDAPTIDGRSDPRNPARDYPRGRVDIELGGEATFNTRAGPARVIETPGHTTGHVSIYLPDERFLVSADALTADEDGLAGPRPDASEDMDRALSSVERLADLDIDRVLCYHGGFAEEGDERIAEIANESG
ncbi:MAG TPA: MBL fold metallo-hydrolase [Halococcus sp.]|nr:MBL fold metallo-hydrolase [Halococcus sp.]